VNLGSGFIAGTPVHTPDGVVAIEQLRAGDLVLARPPAGGPACSRPVTRTVAYPDLEVLYVGYGTGDRSDALTVGFHHPFWVEIGSGVEADVTAAMHGYGRAMAQGDMAAHSKFGKLWSINRVAPSQQKRRWWKKR
jgi:hypothetical protein